MSCPDHTAEEWRPVVGYEGWYEVSSLGRVKRVRPGRGVKRMGTPLRFALDSWGYPHVVLVMHGRSCVFCNHRLVALAFIGPKPHGKEINHKSGDKTDASVGNLEYVTPSENILHAIRTGLWPSKRGELNGRAILTVEKVREIRAEAASGAGRKSLAVRFGVCKGVIDHVVTRRSWKHVA